jgi:pantetheine-phosphate adenylyltransferase
MGKNFKGVKGKRIAVYAGTFDPITFGHLDIIERALKLFDELIVLVAKNPVKKTLFNEFERKKLIEESVKKWPNVRVEIFNGLLVEFLKNKGLKFIVRGLRELSDFEFEFQYSVVNKKLDSDIETVFFMTSPEFFYLNSSMVKEIVRFQGSARDFVPEHVESALENRLLKKGL